MNALAPTSLKACEKVPNAGAYAGKTHNTRRTFEEVTRVRMVEPQLLATPWLQAHDACTRVNRQGMRSEFSYIFALGLLIRPAPGHCNFLGKTAKFDLLRCAGHSMRANTSKGMTVTKKTSISEALARRRDDIQSQWAGELKSSISTSAKGRLTSAEAADQAKQFLDLLHPALQTLQLDDINGSEWSDVRAFLDDLSKRRVLAGFSSDETAMFIFSLKRSLFDVLKQEFSGDSTQLADNIWQVTVLLDKLGLYTIKSYQKTREDVINRQQQELLELSTPVVQIWEGILALPMIGTLDSARTQVVMESLLQRIVETESQIAIIDITGVPTVDTLVAQHLLKTVTAIRLMGADCIISGVRPQIAQTIVHLGVDLQGVTTKANLADALSLALKRSGFSFTKH